MKYNEMVIVLLYNVIDALQSNRDTLTLLPLLCISPLIPSRLFYIFRIIRLLIGYDIRYGIFGKRSFSALISLEHLLIPIFIAGIVTSAIQVIFQDFLANSI